MSSPRCLLSAPSSSQTSKHVKSVWTVHHSRRRTAVLREFIIMSANRNTAIARTCEVISTLAPHQLYVPTSCSKNQVVLHFLKCPLFIFVFATWCVLCFLTNRVSDCYSTVLRFLSYVAHDPILCRTFVPAVTVEPFSSHSARYVELLRFA